MKAILYISASPQDSSEFIFGGWASKIITKDENLCLSQNSTTKDFSGTGSDLKITDLYLNAILAGLDSLWQTTDIDIYVDNKKDANVLRSMLEQKKGRGGLEEKYLKLSWIHNVSICFEKSRMLEDLSCISAAQRDKFNKKCLTSEKQNRKTNFLQKVEIYTDGACSHNIKGRPGGWSAIVVVKDKEKIYQGCKKDTSINEMELKAVVESLKVLSGKASEVTIISDSRYVVDGINSLHKVWKNKNWKTSSNKEVAEKNLWIRYIQLSKNHKVKAKWVKGHSGNHMNERCDKMAVFQRDIQKERI